MAYVSLGVRRGGLAQLMDQIARKCTAVIQDALYPTQSPHPLRHY